VLGANTAELAYVHTPAIIQLHIGQIPLGPVPCSKCYGLVTRKSGRPTACYEEFGNVGKQVHEEVNDITGKL